MPERPLPGGIQRREPTESELEFFRRQPETSGYAAEDDAVVLNPSSPLSPEERESVALNEATRIYLRLRPDLKPDFNITAEQYERFSRYGSLDDIRATLAARLLSGDPSAMSATPEQLAYIKRLAEAMGLATSGRR